MKRRVVIEGPEVQDVGYRGFLLDVARDFELPGFSARNLRLEGAVEVLVEGPPESVENFIKFSETNIPETARVSDVRVQDYEGDVMNIIEYAEQFSAFQVPKIVATGRQIVHTQEKMVGNQEKMLGNQEKMLGNQEKMVGNQEKMLGNQEKMVGNQEKMLDKMDTMLKKQDQTISVIREEGEKTRTELGSVVREESGKTRETVREESEKTRETVSTESEKTRDALIEGFTGLKHEHVKTRELSHEIFYSEVQELREEIKRLHLDIEKIKEKVGIA